MTIQSMLWRRIDLPGHEAVRLFWQKDSWRLTGTALFGHAQQPCRLDYQIRCDATWHTQWADVTYLYESAGGSFVAELQVNEAGFVTHYPGLWQSEV